MKLLVTSSQLSVPPHMHFHERSIKIPLRGDRREAIYRTPVDAVEFNDTHRKLALGGESPRLRETALDGLPLVYDRELTGRSIRPWNPRSLCRSESCTPDALNWRSVYGLAVAAAWFLYRRCRLCGVAAPGLLVLLMSPPRFRMEATSSARTQAICQSETDYGLVFVLQAVHLRRRKTLQLCVSETGWSAPCRCLKMAFPRGIARS
jgi:hypothetical protein